ncbi:MAG: hypothetical protein Q8Q04_00930 [archaeon]|nr:hypothetical protein [archaeon]
MKNLTNETLMGRLDCGNSRYENESANELIRRYFEGKVFKEYPSIEEIVKRNKSEEGTRKTKALEIMNKNSKYFSKDFFGSYSEFLKSSRECRIKNQDKPELLLNSMEETAVHTPTQKEYDTLMQIYECGYWLPPTDLPTERNGWILFGKKTCVRAEKEFDYCDTHFYDSNNFRIITPEHFYEVNRINPEKLKEINAWFETYKPERASKGALK